MSFKSILFDKPQNYAEPPAREEPYFFRDLNLDQVFHSMEREREEYNLHPFFSMPLKDIEGVSYRHEILRDLEGRMLYDSIESFAEDLRTMRHHLAQVDELTNEYQKESWFLDAAEIYCNAVNFLSSQLSKAPVKSKGFLAFREYITTYVNSDGFRSLLDETKKLKNDLSSIQYCLHIKGKRITVTKYEGEPDYSIEVLETFQKFKQGVSKDYRSTFYSTVGMNHVEEQIVGLVARLYPDVFKTLNSYYTRHQNYVDSMIGQFDREIQFYTAYIEFIEKLKANHLSFCYPQVTDRSKEVQAYETFDLALANKLIVERSEEVKATAKYYNVSSDPQVTSLSKEPKVVTNDFYLKNPERIFVVSGPNQGGKTTFARMFGQLHYLAKLGYPVPGKKTTLFLFDRLFTHFEKEEHLENLRGKLQDELLRIHQILDEATPNTIVIVNESFTSAMLKDAIFLGKEVLKQIAALDALCVYVTFIDELSTLNEKTVSMVSTIVPQNPALRTYKLIRKPADGLAYAFAIAQKYGLTEEALKRRIAR